MAVPAAVEMIRATGRSHRIAGRSKEETETPVKRACRNPDPIDRLPCEEDHASQAECRRFDPGLPLQTSQRVGQISPPHGYAVVPLVSPLLSTPGARRAGKKD
jgi:hypothetical protein